MEYFAERMMMPLTTSTLFLGCCRSGKSYRMEDLANRSEDYIYILNPFHSLKNLNSKEFFKAGKKEDLRKNAVFYTNSSLILEESFETYKEIIEFSIKNNIRIFIDETDLVEDILKIIYEKGYKNFLLTLQDLFYFQSKYFDYIENIFIGKINDLKTQGIILKTFNINEKDYPLHLINQKEFLKVK